MQIIVLMQLIPQNVKFTKTRCCVLNEKNLKVKILQLNINHCEAAHDLLMQTVRELKVDLAIISEPYKHLNTQPWEMDSIAGAVIWSCAKLPFQNVINSEAGNALLEAIAILDVALLNNGDKPTFVRGETNSIVNLTFVSCCLVKGNFPWKVMDIYTASDHSALLCEMTTGFSSRCIHEQMLEYSQRVLLKLCFHQKLHGMQLMRLHPISSTSWAQKGKE
ncbi:hypothetical protein HELRODRAFT_163839 [Helobdella robusta]|uniref:Endonuclease/exonuclease/phosphatase domain-containing protein n=1 Tax=Helobdella robusta TaxID=6412 RepID=T1EUJ1_HELRO|nr:hypothetical protein HELRODRAFT_163839 [Helobdella robusta]ESN96734.1 hypothetical protein HELRODRAFT_163839 [Helobdella robusta]